MKFLNTVSWFLLSSLTSATSVVPRDEEISPYSLDIASTVEKRGSCWNGAQTRSCWTPGFDINTDKTTKWPNTGAVREYNFDITNTTMSLDGTPRLVFAVNGQVPGPKIIGNWGDIFKVTVNNKLQNNGTSIHWHGMRMLNQNDQDGVNGITECPIAPGSSKTYMFQATEYGTSWYHSHFSGQYGEGVNGAIQIKGPAAANYDNDFGPVQIAELWNVTTFQQALIVEQLMWFPTASNYVLNGMNASPDGKKGTRQKWVFEQGSRYLLRLINSAVDNHFNIQIDNHYMTVIAADFTPIKPYNTTSLSIAIGQRYDVVIHADQPVANYYFRAIAASACSSNLNTGLGVANGIIKYKGASNSILPNTTYYDFSSACADESAASIVPIVAKPVPSDNFVSKVEALPVGAPSGVSTAEGVVVRWSLKGVSQNIDWSNPTLKQAINGNLTYAVENNVVQLKDGIDWTYWVIQNQFVAPHPMHIHGHEFSVLGSGSGDFTSDMISQLNFVNPPRRDTVMLPGNGWYVVAFETDNPGAWLMHCHIAWHAGEGLSMQFLEQPASIASNYKAELSSMSDNCANWDAYIASGPVYPKTDSGVKKRQAELAQRHVAQYRRRHAHTHGGPRK